MKEDLDKIVLNHFVEQDDIKNSDYYSNSDISELLKGGGYIPVLMPKFLIRELVLLQQVMKISLGEMLVKALRDFIDKKKVKTNMYGLMM